MGGFKERRKNGSLSGPTTGGRINSGEGRKML